MELSSAEALAQLTAHERLLLQIVARFIVAAPSSGFRLAAGQVIAVGFADLLGSLLKLECTAGPIAIAVVPAAMLSARIREWGTTCPCGDGDACGRVMRCNDIAQNVDERVAYLQVALVADNNIALSMVDPSRYESSITAPGGDA